MVLRYCISLWLPGETEGLGILGPALTAMNDCQILYLFMVARGNRGPGDVRPCTNYHE